MMTLRLGVEAGDALRCVFRREVGRGILADQLPGLSATEELLVPREHLAEVPFEVDVTPAEPVIGEELPVHLEVVDVEEEELLEGDEDVGMLGQDVVQRRGAALLGSGDEEVRHPRIPVATGHRRDRGVCHLGGAYKPRASVSISKS